MFSVRALLRRDEKRRSRTAVVRNFSVEHQVRVLNGARSR